MGNRSFFNALHDREGDFLLATVLEGPAQGERVLLRNTAPVWPEELSAFWGKHLPALAAVTSSGILKSAGQRIFVERFGAAPQLVVCGGGHVGASVVRLAKLLGLPVTALEDRPEFAEELRQAGADAVLCLPFAEGLAQIPGGQETYFVVVTRAHSCDIACLRSILQKPAAYVGMMGSRKRAALVHTQLAELGLPQERIDALHAPIGLSIGAKTAQEIALSILAEIVSVKNSRQQTEGFSPALLAALEQQTAPAVLATIVGRHGSTPREEGSKMLVLPDGSAVGSVGGGIMEYRTQQLARELLEPGAAPCRLAAFTTEGASDAAAIAACGCRQASCEKLHFDEHEAFSSLCFLEQHLTLQQLQAAADHLFADAACGHVLRVKGFAPDPQGTTGWLELNATAAGRTLEPIPQGQDVLIVIGEGLDKAAIEARLKA